MISLERNEPRLLDAGSVDQLLTLPTANIWGENDELWPGTSKVLSSFCSKENNSVFVHKEGHNVPGVKEKLALTSAVRAIRRTINKALNEAPS